MATILEGDVPAKHLALSEPASAPARSTTKSVLIVTIATSAMLINIMNASCTALALGTIGFELHTPPSELQWLVSAYTLSSGCLLLLFGRLADLYGRKRVFIFGSIWQTLFTLGCAFAQDIVTLDILRGFQGVGAAANIPAAIGVLAVSFPPSRARSIAFATFAAGAPIGAGLGLICGGLLTEYSAHTWRSNFYLLTALGAVCTFGAMWIFDADVIDENMDKRVDWIGALLVTAGLVLIVFVLSDGEIAPQQWRTSYIIPCLVVGVVLVVAFLFWQYYLESAQSDSTKAKSSWLPPPMMKLSLWKRANGRMAVILGIGFFNWCAFLGWYFWAQLYYQEYLRLSPVLTMIRLLPMTVSGIICNVIIAVIISRVPVVTIVVVGAVLTGGAAILFALIDVNQPYWAFGFPAAIISVVGGDFVMAAGSIFVAKIALPHEQSLAGALFQTMTQLGTSFGLTITTIVFDRVSQTKTMELDGGMRNGPPDQPPPPEAQLAGYRAAQWTCVGFAGLTALLALVALWGVGVVGHQQVKPTESIASETEEKE